MTEAVNRLGAAVGEERLDGVTALRVGAACGVAMASLVPVLLFQTGAIAHLPDPPGAIFDSDRITSSAAAHPLGVPDSIPGLLSYSLTLSLVLLARRTGRGRRLLAGKLLLDGSLAAFNVARQVLGPKRLCSWCTLTAAATGVMVLSGRELLVDEGSRAAAVVAQRFH